MSYGAIEESRKLGAPAELFLFRYGTDPGAVYAYTDVEETVTHGSVDYNPVKIKRGGISASGSLDKSRMTVTVPIDSEIAELFRIYPPGTVVTLTIRGGHLSDPDAEYPVIWVGRVLSSARGKSENTEVELTCEPANTSLRRTGLRRNYQYSCPHVIYSAGDGLCNADIVRATLPGVVLSKTNATVTLEPGWPGAFLPEKFVGGMLVWNAAARIERRTILGLSGDTLRLTGPTPELVIADNVTVVLGCNHQADDCEFLHLNFNNYGGQLFIPKKSPIATAEFSGG